MTDVLETSESRPYHKILGPFKRDIERDSQTFNSILTGEWTKPEFEYLSNLDWLWTEKVDGTNIRVHWDGVAVSFAGRTAKAQIPPKLLAQLNNLFIESLFEQNFESTAVTLYGEGYGGKIQKGGNYRPDENFILFDIRIGNWWLLREDVEDIGKSLGVDVVPQIGSPRSVWAAIEHVKAGVISEVSQNTPAPEAEGLVGYPVVPLFNRKGERAVMKVKAADFKE